MLKTGKQEGRLLSCPQIAPQEISIYFHVPFCSRKCPYCHFFVIPDHKRYKAPFLNALYREWHLRQPQLHENPKHIVSIYFGGGTPTKLEARDIHALLEEIGRTATIAPDCEITLEANPEDVTLEKMRELKSAGVNRLSLGVQSLCDAELKLLERQHNAQGAIQAIHDCHKAGFDNISIDLMFELPTQTLDSWKTTLLQLDELPITHLSLYNLTFEPHTVFFKKRTALEAHLANDEERLAMLQCAIAHLEDIGLKRYEISAFARPGMHSRHNTGYWTARPFLGFGPSAFSYWDKKRFSNSAHFNRYVQTLEQGRLPTAFEECLAYPKNVQELLAVELRLLEGVDLAAFQSRHTALPQETLLALEGLKTRQWLCEENGTYRLTPEGMLFYDSVATDLIS